MIAGFLPSAKSPEEDHRIPLLCTFSEARLRFSASFLDALPPSRSMAPLPPVLPISTQTELPRVPANHAVWLDHHTPRSLNRPPSLPSSLPRRIWNATRHKTKHRSIDRKILLVLTGARTAHQRELGRDGQGLGRGGGGVRGDAGRPRERRVRAGLAGWKGGQACLSVPASLR